MDSNQQIWNLAKWRFGQGEATLWIFSNKVLEIAFFAGVAAWVYFDFFSLSKPMRRLTQVSGLSCIFLLCIKAFLTSYKLQIP